MKNKSEDKKLKFVQTLSANFECEIKKEGILIGRLRLARRTASLWEIRIYGATASPENFYAKSYRGSQANAEAEAVAFYRTTVERDYLRLKAIMEALENHEESTN